MNVLFNVTTNEVFDADDVETLSTDEVISIEEAQSRGYLDDLDEDAAYLASGGHAGPRVQPGRPGDRRGRPGRGPGRPRRTRTTNPCRWRPRASTACPGPEDETGEDPSWMWGHE